MAVFNLFPFGLYFATHALFSFTLNKADKILHYFTAHPWLRDQNCAVPLDICIYKLVKSYIRATPLKRAALKVS